MRDFIKSILMLIINAVVLYYGFSEGYFIARLIIYAQIVFMTFGVVVFGIGTLVIFINRDAQARRTPITEKFPMWKRVTAWVNNFLFAGSFIMTGNSGLAWYYMILVVVGQINIGYIRRRAKIALEKETTDDSGRRSEVPDVGSRKVRAAHQR